MYHVLVVIHLPGPKYWPLSRLTLSGVLGRLGNAPFVVESRWHHEGHPELTCLDPQEILVYINPLSCRLALNYWVREASRAAARVPLDGFFLSDRR